MTDGLRRVKGSREQEIFVSAAGDTFLGGGSLWEWRGTPQIDDSGEDAAFKELEPSIDGGGGGSGWGGLGGVGFIFA